MASIKLLNGAFEVIIIDGKESLALRGVVDPSSLASIITPPYQREILSPTKILVLKTALIRSRVPDIDLGMRGDRVIERDGFFYLQDPVFVIDGLQRKTAGAELVIAGTAQPHIGALVHFNTT